MGAIARWVSFRHLVGEGGRTLLTLLSVALGVGVFVGIRLASRSAMGSFSQTVDAVTGRANLQVTADSTGLDEALYPRIRAIPGVLAAAPVAQVFAVARAGAAVRPGRLAKRPGKPFDETLLLMGIDFTAEPLFQRFDEASAPDAAGAIVFILDPTAVAVTRSLAARHNLREGGTLTVVAGGQQVELTVRYVMDSPELQQAMGGNVVVAALGTVQSLFGRPGKLDRIDLMVEPARRDRVRAAIGAVLPAHARVALPQARTQQVENMVGAFELNLTALSFIALFVALFLIFNAVSMSVLRRRREIGGLRSLGQTRRQVFHQFLAEAALTGAVGSTLGLVLGTVMAKLSLGAVSQTVSVLYLMVQARTLVYDLPTYAAGWMLGLATTLAGALFPAAEAARTSPGVTVRQGTHVEAQRLPVAAWALAGCFLVALSGGVALWTVGARRPLGGFVSAALLVGGLALLAPGFTQASAGLAQPLLRRLGGVQAALGARNLRESLARTSTVVAALMISVGMTVGLAIMVHSFRRTVDVWVGQTLRGDLYVEPVGRTVSGGASVMPPKVIELARSLPGVAAVDTYRGVQILYRERLAYVAALDLSIWQGSGRLQFLQGDSRALTRRARASDGVAVSESFAFRYRINQGDRLELDTPSGRAALPVVGVYYDYSSDAGTILMDVGLYRRLWRDDRTEYIAIYTQPGADVDALRSRLLREVGGEVMLYATPNRRLRERVMLIFDQTFQITYALQGIAVVVAVLGVINTLTALILQRGREIGVLRAVGARRGQVRSMVLIESGLLGLFGSLMGCVCGLLLSLLLTHVINKQFFGWSVRYSLDAWVFAQAVGLMVLTSVLAGIGPARVAGSRVAAEAMRSE